MKNKTVSAWLAFLGGPLGLHRFYLFGWSDTVGWLLPMPTALGIYGIERVQKYGLDDQWSWLLIPLLGFTIAGCALNAIVFGLMPAQRWNERYNTAAESPEAPAGATRWLTIFAVIAALLIGTAALMSSIAFSAQRYFEYQVQEARKISQ